MSHYFSRSEGERRQISAERNVKRKSPGTSLLLHMTSSSLSVVWFENDILCSPASRFVPDPPGPGVRPCLPLDNILRLGL